MGWTITHNIPEQSALQLLSTNTKRPVAVLVIGNADPVAKSVTKSLAISIGTDLFTVHEVATMVDLNGLHSDLFATNHFAFMRFVGVANADHELRHLTVQRLRDAGAQTIVLVYLKSTSSNDDLISKVVEEGLRLHPPTADGLDYLFTLEP